MDGLINRLEAGIAWCERVRREIPCGRAIHAISLPNLENPGPGHELKGIFERVEGVGAACGLPMKRVDAGNVTLPWIEWGRRPGDV
jgi:hypothetical protein